MSDLDTKINLLCRNEFGAILDDVDKAYSVNIRELLKGIIRADECDRCVQDINKLNAVVAAGGNLLFKADVIEAIKNPEGKK